MKTYKTETKLLQLKTLQESSGNPQKMNDKTFTGLIDSIKRKGWYFAMPDVWEYKPNKYRIISGHHRIMAAIEVGIVEQNCNVIKDKRYTEAQARKDLLESNERHGDPDPDLLQDFVTDLIDDFDVNIDELVDEIGFDDSILNNILMQDDEKDDEVPEVAEVVFSKLGDLYLLNGHRVLCGDSTEEKQMDILMRGEKAEVVFTSPPYNANTTDDNGKKLYEDYKDNLSSEDYISFCQKVLFNVFKNTKGFIFWNVMYNNKSRVEYIKCIYPYISYLWETIVWSKSALPCTSGLTRNYEFIFCFKNGEKNHLGKKNSVEFALWEIKKNKGIQTERNKACFPVELVSKAIVLSSSVNGIVLDVFLGSGTTLISAEKTKRVCLGIELTPVLVDLAIRRYIKYTGSKENCYLIRDNKKTPLSDIKELNNG